MLAGLLRWDRLIIYDIDGFMASAHKRPIYLDLMQASLGGSFNEQQNLLVQG
jgi:hypothetical protein